MQPSPPQQIFASYNDQWISVYQAYNSSIANETMALGHFGSQFKRDRMTWIKPSFLWMMYRSEWGTAPNQERVLAIKLMREGFNKILEQAVLTRFETCVYSSREEWQEMLKASDVRCQWDPDRTLTGAPLPRRAIQLGLKGRAVQRYVDEWCIEIQDITEFVHQVGALVRAHQPNLPPLPEERLFPVSQKVAKQLGMDINDSKSA